MATTLQDIQSALNTCLPDQNLKLQLNHSGSQLSVVINRPPSQMDVDYEGIAQNLTGKLRSLNLPNVKSVKLYGRATNTKQIEWQLSQPLVDEVAKPVNSSSKPLTGNSNNGTSDSASPQRVKSQFQTYLEQFSHYSNVISALSLLGLLVLLGFNTLAGQKTQTVAYEYKIDSVPDLAFTESMNRMGSEGWELVFARRAKDSGSDDFSYECIFKRVKK